MADRLALIIANSEFDDPRLTRLATPSRDAEALVHVLRDPEIGGFYLTVLIDKPQRVVRREIARLYQRRRKEDLVLFYYSGHGFKDDFGDLYLAVRDTEKDVLGATAIEAAFVRTQMDRSSSQRKVVMLDCCHSGAFARGGKALGSSAGAREAFAGTGYGRVILTASNALEYAWEGDRVLGEAANSVFTHFLVQGLSTGAADLDGDGQIALSELYEYVYDQVLSSGVTRQTPEMWAEKVQGEIRIAWNPHLQRQKELERLYQQAEASVKNRAWAEAVDLFQRVQALQPGYRQVDALLRQAQDGLRQDEAERERQAKLFHLYEQAEVALQQNRWQRAMQLVAEIETLEPNYRDVRRLQEQAEAVLRREQTQQRVRAQLASLYEQLQTAVEQEDWAEVLALGGQIQARDADYRDVKTLMERARRHLSRATHTPQTRPAVSSGLSSLPGWVWALGAAGLAVILFIILQTMGNKTPVPLATPTKRLTETPTATSAKQPTKTSTVTPSPPPPIQTATDLSEYDVGDTRTRPADGMVMVYMPGSTFEMGSSERGPDEQPPHDVTLDSFWIDKYEVTNTQYRKCVEAGVCDAPTTCGWGEPTYGDESKADHPVVCVDWDGANAYCEWAGARLPTEAEWEYAARGREGSVYPWGGEFDCSRGNFDDETYLNESVVPGGAGCDGFDRTAPVGSFETGASWCEALDMAGNVWEWVNDWYQADYYAVSPDSNPTGPEGSNFRVLRGGSWYNLASHVRSAYRGKDLPHCTVDYVGFRCVVAATSLSP